MQIQRSDFVIFLELNLITLQRKDKPVTSKPEFLELEISPSTDVNILAQSIANILYGLQTQQQPQQAQSIANILYGLQTQQQPQQRRREVDVMTPPSSPVRVVLPSLVGDYSDISVDISEDIAETEAAVDGVLEIMTTE